LLLVKPDNLLKVNSGNSQPLNEDSKTDGIRQTVITCECPENLIGKKFKRAGRYQLFFCAKFSQYALGVWILNNFQFVHFKDPNLPSVTDSTDRHSNYWDCWNDTHGRAY